MDEQNDDTINQKLAEYAKNFEEYIWTCKKANNILNNFALSNSKIVYSIKSRIKTAESLINKLRKKNHSADIVGLRILYYFWEDLHKINNYLRENFNCNEIEIYVFKDKEDIFKRIFQKEGVNLKINTDKPTESGYTGIHYIVSLKNDDRQNHMKIPIEIQVKTLFEEAWGELEHDIGYKHPPMEIQTFFLDISKRLSIEHETMTKLKKYIDEQTQKFSEAVTQYYPFDDPQVDINQLLIDLDVKVDKALENIRSLDKLGTPYQKLLSLDIRLESLRIIFNDTTENWKIKVESVLLKTFFGRLLKGEGLSQKDGDILQDFSSDPNNLSKFLNNLNDMLKGDLRITRANGVDMVNDFLKEIWEKSDSEKFLVLEIIPRIGDVIKDFDKWTSSIKKYFETVKDDRDKEEIIQIIVRSPKLSDLDRKESWQSLLSELKKLRGDA